MDYYYITIIGLIILLILLYVGSIYPLNSLLDRFSNKISVFAGFFIGIGVLVSYDLLRITEHNTNVTTTYNFVHKSYCDLLEKIISKYEECPIFIESLMLPWQKKILINNNYSFQNNNEDKWYSVYLISINIFQFWQDFLLAYKLSQFDISAWIGKNINFAHSKRLYDVWNNNKFSYNNQTQQLGNILFENVLNYNIENINDVNILITKINNSNEFINLMKQV